MLGTLYHIVPFIIRGHRYSDLLGYEPVPMSDDLYNGRIATVDFVAVVAGTGFIVFADWFTLPPVVLVVGGLSAMAGFGLFVVNMLLAIRDHSPYGLRGILMSTSGSPEQNRASESREPPSEGR